MDNIALNTDADVKTVHYLGNFKHGYADDDHVLMMIMMIGFCLCYIVLQ